MTRSIDSAPQLHLPLAPTRVIGHFGELMQGRLGTDGPVALVSLPCPALFVELNGTEGARLEYPSGWVDQLASALGTTAPLDRPELRGTMPPGAGAGASTATLVALAQHLGFDGSPAELATLCRSIEGATDPLMFASPERLLFAPREARVLQDLPPLPRMEVIGGFFGPPIRTNPQDQAFPDISDLVEAWHAAPPLAELAQLASQSAARTLDLRGPEGDPTEAIARELGALGWFIAHTGNARGLIFAPGKTHPHAATALSEAGFAQVLHFSAGEA